MPQKSFVHKGRIFDFVREKVSLPNGVSKFYDIVKHRGAVVIIPLISKNKVILIKQYRVSIKKYILELPAGSIDVEEKPFACAKRELAEETGYFSKKIKSVGKLIPCPGYSTEILYIYKAEDLIKHRKIFGKQNVFEKDEDEVIKPIVYSREQVKKMIKNGKIIDAKTIASFALIGWL